jgi:hypothetical protein
MFVIELCMRAPSNLTSSLEQWLADAALPAAARLPGLLWADSYRPETGPKADPCVDDGPGPAGLLMLAFENLAAASEGLTDSAFRTNWALQPRGLSFSSTAFERLVFPVAGEIESQPLVAPFSYVVRYHRPAEDEAAFVRNYIASHAPMLGGLPFVRNVMCYLPHPWADPNGLPASSYMLGNEVVFDDHAAFSNAMASDFRQELRAHWREFPTFTGANTHYPMTRQRIKPVR